MTKKQQIVLCCCTELLLKKLEVLRNRIGIFCDSCWFRFRFLLGSPVRFCLEVGRDIAFEVSFGGGGGGACPWQLGFCMKCFSFCFRADVGGVMKMWIMSVAMRNMHFMIVFVLLCGDEGGCGDDVHDSCAAM